ncbi:acetyl-CoA synthetase-like protein [Macroventuria anomochaeta]|uniref:Acetyl-CoA synthetase-like protein n=1 Tax=Macroventuria anomochaeta TaxID=301207 RepID=A0ACB6RY88_9PLEO|nr:acetyl-CoA synthetase-like protein [Macroventuria anomochaeta]KAF2626836.1 acetyl-CoA synthetase-like protein [Macroventuria anomochaeta]
MPFLAEEHIDIPMTDLLSWMFDEQKYDADKPIYVDAAEPTRSFSSNQARCVIRKLCDGFKSIGLKEGDCVCMLSFNDIYYSMAFLGILSFGGIFAGVNPSHTPYELTHAFRTAEIKALIVEPELLPNALKAAAQAGIPQTHIFVYDHHTPVSQPWNKSDVRDKELGRRNHWSGLKSWRYPMSHGQTDWVRWDNQLQSKSTTAARLFSSGTTGLPKAVEMTHHNFIAQHTMVLEHNPRDYEIIRLLCTPMFHVSNVPRAHTSPLRSGLRTHIMWRFELQSWLQNIERFGITEANMVPPMELIKVRGFQVAPAELEGVLLSHPKISDAAVIGVSAGGASRASETSASLIAMAGEEGSEMPRAYIVLKQGSQLGEKDVQAYMKEKLAGYKQLVGGVRFIDSIPQNASGKILKKDLRDIARKEISARL